MVEFVNWVCNKNSKEHFPILSSSILNLKLLGLNHHDVSIVPRHVLFLFFLIINTMRTTLLRYVSSISCFHSCIWPTLSLWMKPGMQQWSCLLDWFCGSHIANNSCNVELALKWVRFELWACTWYTEWVAHLANRLVSISKWGRMLARSLQFRFLGSPVKV